MTNKKLALLGGEPVRKKPYPSHSTNIDSEEKKLVMEVLDSGKLSGFAAGNDERFYGGSMVKRLEKDFCSFFNVKYAIAFNSATSALHASIAACGIGPGDEVITSPITMTATPTSIIMNNAIPVFADVEDTYFCIDPKSVKQRISPRTKAILTVNLCGQSSDIDALRLIADEHKCFLIEDNSHAPGTLYNGKLTGTTGDIGIVSLNYHKIIQTGEGGLALTNDAKLAQRLQLIRNHGETSVESFGIENITNIIGYNYRLTEMEAAVGIAQLKKMEKLIERKRLLANFLTDQLKNFDFIQPPIIRPECTHTFYIYMAKYYQDKLGISRDLFIRAIEAEGVWLKGGYIKPLYLLPAYQRQIGFGNQGCPFKCPIYGGNISYQKGLCTTAEHLYEKEIIFTIQCKYPLTEDDMMEIVTAIRKVSDNINILKKME